MKSHNFANSAYRRQKDLGKVKVHALREIVAEQAGIEIRVHDRHYAGEPLSGAVLCCVDDMDQRAIIWKAVRESRALVPRFLDTRLERQLACVYCVRPDMDDADPDSDVAQYLSVLYPTSAALRPTCGNGTPMTVTTFAANAAVNQLARAWRGEPTQWVTKYHVATLRQIV